MSSGDSPSARCSHCGAVAVGPCARCQRPTCGDCCELTEGGATTFAVGLACVKRGGRSLTAAYGGLLLWLSGDTRHCTKCGAAMIAEVILGDRKYVNTEVPEAIADLHCYKCKTPIVD